MLQNYGLVPRNTCIFMFCTYCSHFECLPIIFQVSALHYFVSAFTLAVGKSSLCQEAHAKIFPDWSISTSFPLYEGFTSIHNMKEIYKLLQRYTKQKSSNALVQRLYFWAFKKDIRISVINSFIWELVSVFIERIFLTHTSY